MKKFLILCLALIMLLAFAACGGGGGKDDDKFEYGNGADFIAKNLKGDYSITYRYSYSSDSSNALVMTYTKTSNGIYYSYNGIEGLYVKNGSKYDIYQKDEEDGVFRKVDFMDPITQAELENDPYYSLTFLFLEGFMSQYGSFASGMKKTGSETVAGRNCDKYTYSFSGGGMAYKYTTLIDKTTGVCLKWQVEGSVYGQTSNVTFECTEFKTSGVTLPAH